MQTTTAQPDRAAHPHGENPGPPPAAVVTFAVVLLLMMVFGMVVGVRNRKREIDRAARTRWATWIDAPESRSPWSISLGGGRRRDYVPGLSASERRDYERIKKQVRADLRQFQDGQDDGPRA